MVDLRGERRGTGSKVSEGDGPSQGGELAAGRWQRARRAGSGRERSLSMRRRGEGESGLVFQSITGICPCHSSSRCTATAPPLARPLSTHLSTFCCRGDSEDLRIENSETLMLSTTHSQC